MKRPTAPLLVQLLTLTGVTLVAAWAMSAFLLFYLPPPAPDFYRLSEIEATLRGAPPTFTERKPLESVLREKPPAPALEGRTIPDMRDKIARDLGVRPPTW